MQHSMGRAFPAKKTAILSTDEKKCWELLFSNLGFRHVLGVWRVLMRFFTFYFQLANTSSSFLDSFTCSSGQLSCSSGVLTSHCIQFKGQVTVESLVGCLEHIVLVTEKWGADSNPQGGHPVCVCVCVSVHSHSHPQPFTPGERFWPRGLEPIHTCSWEVESFRNFTSWWY